MNPSSPTVDIEGYLYKKEGVGGFKKWQRRWATLCDYCLYLYDNHGDRESRYAFLLPSVSVSCCAGDGEFQQLIKLEEPQGKIVLLAASNAVEFEEWFNTLSSASRLKRVKRQDIRSAPSNLANHSNDLEAMRSASSRPLMRPDDGYLVREEELMMPPMAHNMGPQRAFPQRSSQDNLAPPRQYREMSADGSMVPTRDKPLNALPNRRTDIEDPTGGFVRNAQPVFRNPIHTVKEDPAMADSDVLATRPLEEIKMKYPVSGLAKRMSIAASDLLGKSHDELLISLIQLNREKANLESLRTYLLLVLDRLHEDQAECDSLQSEAEIQERIRRTIHELADVEHQIEISLPLITFIDNIVKMGAMYAGDDVMFATEYRKHLLSPQQYSPAKANITFARKVQEQQVARTLSLRAPGTASGSGIYDMLNEGSTGGPVGESAGYRQTREALERELDELQTIYSTFLGKRNELSAYMKDLPVSGGFIPSAEPTSSTIHRRQRRKSGGDAPAPENSIDFPRRSTSKQPRSDTTNSLRRRQSLGASSDAARHSYTLSAARSRPRERNEPLDSSRSHSLPLRKERTAAAPQFTTFERTPRPASQRLEAERWRDSYENGERSDSYPKITASVAPHQHSAVPPPKPPRGYFLKSDDEDGRPRSALQDQLDVLLGQQRYSSSSDRGSRRHLDQLSSDHGSRRHLDQLSSDHGSRRHLDQLSSDRPLVQLTPSRYGPGTSPTTRLSLDRPRSSRELRVDVSPDVSPRPQLPRLFVDDDVYDPAYDRLSATKSAISVRSANGAVSIPKQETVRRQVSPDFGEEDFEDFDDDDGSAGNFFDDGAIDRALFIPDKVAIRERYDPNSDTGSEMLDEEERRRRRKRAGAIRRMLATHSLQEWTEAEVSSSPRNTHSIDRHQIEEEKIRREAILELRGSLAVEVKEKSKAAARARELNRQSQALSNT